MSKAPQVKNRSAAAIQITAEQLLRIANNQGIERVEKAPTQFITDREELQLYQQTKRKDFEDQLRRSRQHIGIWCKYALWEASQKEFERARSVFERALDVDYRNQTIWLKYADMEMKNKFVNHARNVWDRAVTLHPRVDSFWYKYSYMEELLGAIDNARAIFERWMAWDPDDLSWAAYIKFEMRQGQIERARAIYERYIALLPTCRAYLKYAKWEEQLHQRALARNVYERALAELHPTERTEKLLVNFARFEERCKEIERARVIYQYALSQLEGNDRSDDVSELKKEFIAFEKRHGDKANIESAIVAQRREHYNQLLQEDVYDYDTWFDYIRLEENESDVEAVRAVYNRAVACVPPVLEKRYWRRYVYLWVNYAIYEELTAKDVSQTREVYRAALQVIPHKKFTFGKIWLMAAHFEVRQKDLAAARKLLGQGIGMCGKENIFRGYVELELQLGEIDRCRAIYSKYIERMPHNCAAWRNFAQLEANVGELQRARAIYELAVSQVDLDMPEVLWTAYIDFEVAEGELDNARKLYERLLFRSSHVKVWIAYARFEFECGAGGPAAGAEGKSEGAEESKAAGGSMENARAIFSKGYEALKSQGLKEERLLLLEAWRDAEAAALAACDAENSNSQKEHLAAVEAKFPRKIKMRRPVLAEDGETELGSEEYFDYVFPDDEKKIVGMKILEQAMMWKKMAAAGAAAGSAGVGAANSSNSMSAAGRVGGDEDGEIDIDGPAGDGADGEAEGSALGKRKSEREAEAEEEEEG